MQGESMVVVVVLVFWLFSLLVARMDGERIGYWKGEAAAAKRQREAVERECYHVAQLMLAAPAEREGGQDAG